MKKLTLLLVLVLLPLSLFAQKSLIETPAILSYESTSNSTQPLVQTSDATRERINQIVKELSIARANGNAALAEQLNNELEAVSGNQSYKSTNEVNGPMVTSIAVNEPVDVTDYNLTIINSADGFWSIATSTDRVTGRIWAVGTKYNGAGSDTVKIFSSTNEGMTWVLISRIQFSATGVHFRADEMDIEAVNNGTTSYLFVVAGLDYGTSGYSLFFRTNTTGAEFTSAYLGTSSATVKNIYPRITSDNARYTNLSYVYCLWTQDSTRASDRVLKSMFAIIQNPFASTPTITYRNFSSIGSYWWQTSVDTGNDTTFQHNDIAFSDSLGNPKVVTVTNVYRGTVTNLFLTYTNDYGATSPTWVPQITDTKPNKKATIAATGLDSTTMMIVSTRQYSATDWDPYYFRTVNNGVNWSTGYVSATSDTTLSADVVAIPRVPNTFRIAYSVRTGSNTTSNIFLRTFTRGNFAAIFQLNPVGLLMSGTYTPVRAGYRYSADSCFTLGSSINGSGMYAFAGCSGTITGVGNNEVPASFSLSQNYPNPFNPVTKISYAIPKSGFVSLKVYDVLGREAAALVNEVKNAGSYTVDFNASGFTSGIYFYRLEVNGLSEVRKMMLLK